MNPGELMAEIDFILLYSKHTYDGNFNDCKVLSDAYGRKVEQCRNFAVEGDYLSGLINIVESVFKDGSRIVGVTRDTLPVFTYGIKSRGDVPRYEFLNRNTDWQEDIHLLAVLTERGL